MNKRLTTMSFIETDTVIFVKKYQNEMPPRTPKRYNYSVTSTYLVSFVGENVFDGIYCTLKTVFDRHYENFLIKSCGQSNTRSHQIRGASRYTSFMAEWGDLPRDIGI